MTYPILSIITFLPLVAVTILALFMRGDDAAARQGAKWLALFTTSATFVISLFILMAGAAATLNGTAIGGWVLGLGFVGLFTLFFLWFGEVIRENQAGLYNEQVDRSFRMGMMWFIMSEVLFFAVFFGGQTTNRPRKYINADANANAALSSRLPYILAASRFAHYIKVIVRDKIGGFLTRGNVEAFLNNWISQYVLIDDSASQEVKSAFPLREASIVVVDVPGEPGSYKATVFLKPHFQLEELTTSIRLVANLPK
ncbi:MAG: hypothetical protein HC937_01115 [Aquincola sp.]|nr:hypothetical protein [Aquincola sp.]